MAATESNAESNAARDRADADSPDAPTKAKPSYRWHILIVVVGVGIVLGGVVYLQELRYQEIDQLLKDGDARQALSGTVKMLTDRPSDPRALALQARCLVAMEFNPLKAIEIFDQVGASKKEELHAWAKAYMLTNNWSAALSLLTRVRELDAENADVLYETTICHLRMGDRGEALVTAERFAAMKGHEAPGYMFIATIATDDDNYRRAVLAFEKVFEFEPEAAGLQLAPVEIYYAYGRALLAIGEAERARDALLKSLSLTLPAPPPEAYDTYVTLGNAFTQLGDGGKARTAWSSALALNENGQEARQFLANSDLKAGRPGAALAWIAPVEDRPDLSAATAYTIQRVYQALDNAEKANKWRRLVEQLRKRDDLNEMLDNVLGNSPNSVEAMLVRAYRSVERAEWAQARAITEALTIQIGGKEKYAKYQDYTRALSKAAQEQSADLLPSLFDFPLETPAGSSVREGESKPPAP